MDLLIYSGPGAGKRSIQEAYDSLSRLLPELSPRLLTTAELMAGLWIKNTAILVMPGGRDLPYCEALNGRGNDLISKYVEQGGRYLGFCAGAYYASKQIEFELGTNNEVKGKRELAFFRGTAIGSALGPGSFSYENEESAKSAAIESIDGSRMRIYFDGGCWFRGCSENQILARYTELPNNPAAAIQVKVGAGTAVLCGVHPEFSCTGCMENRPDLASELLSFEPDRLKFLSLLVTSLLAENKDAARN